MMTNEQRDIQKLQLDLAQANGTIMVLAALVSKIPGAETVNFDDAVKRARQLPLPSRTADTDWGRQVLARLFPSAS